MGMVSFCLRNHMKVSRGGRVLNGGVLDSAFFFACGLALFIYSLVSHYSLQTEWKLSPYLFPLLISVFIIALSVSLFLESGKVVGMRNGKNEKLDWKGFFAFLAASFAYWALMPLLGFIASNILYLVILFIISGERKWWKISLLSIITTFVIYLLFDTFLHVMLP